MLIQVYKSDKYLFNRNKFFELYYELLRSRNLDKNEFLNNIKTKFKEEFDSFNKIKEYLVKNKTEYSVLKTEIMQKIINYVENDKKDTKLNEEIDKLIIKTEIKKDYKLSKRDEKLHKESMEKIMYNINTVLNDNRSYNKLLENGIVTDKAFFSKLNKNIKYIDDEKYIDFFIKYKDINKLKIEELKQYQEVLIYFVIYLKKNIRLLNKFEDEKEIRNFYVCGQEDLSNFFISNSDRLKKWKLNKMTELVNYYESIYKTIDSLLNNDTILKKEKMDKEIMKNEPKFVLEYDKLLLDFLNGLKSIKGLKNISDDRNKTLCKKYVNKIIENN